MIVKTVSIYFLSADYTYFIDLDYDSEEEAKVKFDDCIEKLGNGITNDLIIEARSGYIKNSYRHLKKDINGKFKLSYRDIEIEAKRFEFSEDKEKNKNFKTDTLGYCNIKDIRIIF